jgi:hypothetical protein
MAIYSIPVQQLKGKKLGVSFGEGGQEVAAEGLDNKGSQATVLAANAA